LTATSGTITDIQPGETTTGVTNITAGALSLTANSIGTAGVAGTLETDVGSLTTDTSGGNGNQFIDEADGLALLTLNAGSGNIELNTGAGAITDGDPDALGADTTTNILATTLTLTGNGAVTDIETAVDSLALATAATSIRDAGSLDLLASTVSGSLSLVTSGVLTQTGALDVTGSATFNSGNNDITLDNAGNAFASTVTFNGLTTTANLSVLDTTALQLQSGLAVNNLTVEAAGITQAGPLTVAGTATLDGGANAVTLTNASNDFQGTVDIGGGTDVALADVNSMTLGTASLTGLYAVTADGITLSGNIGAGSVDLDVSGGVGAIDQTGGVLTVSTTSTLSALTSDAITLGQANLFGGAVTVVQGGDVTLRDADNLTLGKIDVSGTFGVTVNGGITGSSTGTETVTVVGVSTFDTTGYGGIEKVRGLCQCGCNDGSLAADGRGIEDDSTGTQTGQQRTHDLQQVIVRGH